MNTKNLKLMCACQGETIELKYYLDDLVLGIEICDKDETIVAPESRDVVLSLEQIKELHDFLKKVLDNQ